MNKNILKIGDKGIYGTLELKDGLLISNFLGFKLAFKAPMSMTDILKVNEFDINDGYIAFETNYDEEYLDLESLFDDNGLDYSKILEETLNGDGTTGVFELDGEYLELSTKDSELDYPENTKNTLRGNKFMGKFFKYPVCGYYLYHTAKCGVEPIHIHASDKHLTEKGSAKIWMSRYGDTKVAHQGNISDADMKEIRKHIKTNYEEIIDIWENAFGNNAEYLDSIEVIIAK